MRSCPLQRCFGRMKYVLNFLNRHWFDIYFLGFLSLTVHCTAVGFRSKIIEIKISGGGEISEGDVREMISGV